MKSIFVTGVDTDIGKTFVSIGLCLKMIKKGKKTGYFKPFQSGGYFDKNDRANSLLAPDIEEIKKYDINIPCTYSYLLKGEVSPYLAAVLNTVEVDINKVKSDFEEFSQPLDMTIIEGAGGFYCPCYKKNLFSDVIKFLKQDIIIVTTPTLGRINHTLMTIKCAQAEGINIKGIIINKVPKNSTLSESRFVEELKAFSEVEILGIIPELKNPTKDEILRVFEDINL